MKKYNPFAILKYQLYLLQLENYEIGRYWKLLFTKGFYFSSDPLRKKLVWTRKIALILLLTLIIVVIKTYSLIILGFGVAWILIILLAVLLLTPVLFSAVTILLWPFDKFIKVMVVNRAKGLVSAPSKVKIIGIAGSYGKTTMKNVMANVLSAKYNTIATPESVNTPVGIARWITKNLKPSTEVMIVEMGEHYPGDVSYLCGITPPDFAVITGINEAHLERMKDISGVTKTVFEIVAGSKTGATILVNVDDGNVLAAYPKYVGEREVLKYSASGKNSDVPVSDKKFDVDKLVWNFGLADIGKVEVAILGEYIAGDVAAAYLVAKKLGLTTDEIKRGIRAIAPISHRLEPIKSPGNILVIDDSYNGNPDGVHEAIYLLERFSNRRKLFITPGIVETGESNKSVHEKIGVELANVADKVILIRNSATPHIARGLVQNGFKEENILWFETAEAAHAALSGILAPNDVILFQNDWGDQYV